MTHFKAINFPHGKNLYNRDASVIGSIINSTGKSGDVSSTSWAVTDFITVLPNMTIKLSHSAESTSAYNCFYDANKEPIITSLITLTDTGSVNGV